MRFVFWLGRSILLLSALIAAGCDRTDPTTAGAEGSAHAHGAAGHRASDEGPEPVGLTLFTSRLELFMEYPPLVRGEAARFLAHLTVLETGEPLREGSIVFEARADGGDVVSVSLDAPMREGLYVPEVTFPQGGDYEASIAVSGPQVSDTIALGRLRVHPDEASMRAASEGEPPDEPPNAVPFLMEQQWKVRMRLEEASRRTLRERLRCVGEVVPPSEASAVVSAPVSGRLRAPLHGWLPQLGDRVAAGQVMAMIEPPLPVLTEVSIRALDLQEKGLEMARSLADAAARLEYCRREHERVESLLERGVASEQQRDEALRNLRMAEAEHDSALRMGASVEEGRRQLAQLQAAARATTQRDEQAADLLQVPLAAPIDGEVVATRAVHGEHVEAGGELFRILDLERVWIVTRVSEFDLARLPAAPDAAVVLHALPDRVFDVRALGGRFVHLGSVVESESRTIALRYELPNPDGVFRAGMFADVMIETARSTEAVTIPEAALVMDAGRPAVFVLLEGELFQKREVEIGIRDGGYVEVRGGLSPGERVVTRGAYAIRLSSMSGAALGHGHVH